MSKIYENKGSYYRMLKPVGHTYRRGYEYYALWRPVKRIKILFFTFYVSDKSKQDFYLDMEGFKVV